MVPRSATSEAGATVVDAVDYLDHREYEIALDILTELGDAYAAETSFWNLLADAAAEMNLHRATKPTSRARSAVLSPGKRSSSRGVVIEASAPSWKKPTPSGRQRIASPRLMANGESPNRSVAISRVAGTTVA